jgi:hypothetical protein
MFILFNVLKIANMKTNFKQIQFVSYRYPELL